MTVDRNDREQDSLWPWVVGMALVAGLIRLVPHPFNLTPVGALALFCGARLKSRLAALIVPVAVLFVSDLALWTNHDYPPFDYFVYGCFLFTVILGYGLRDGGPARIAAFSLLTSMVFFLVTNLGVWAYLSVDPATLPDGQAMTWQTYNGATYPVPDKYARNAAGLAACYAAAIPFTQTNALPLGFLGNQVIGDLFYCGLFFGAYALLKRGLTVPLAVPVR